MLLGIDRELADIKASQARIEAELNSVSLQLHAIKLQLDYIQKVLEQVQQATSPQPAVRFVFSCLLDGVFYSEVESMIIKATQQFTATIQPVDAKGNPALVDGVPVWSSSNPAVLTVEPAADGMSATVKAVGPVGTGQVAVTADADMGEGVKSIIGTLDVEVKPGDAVTLTVNTGTVSEQ